VEAVALPFPIYFFVINQSDKRTPDTRQANRRVIQPKPTDNSDSKKNR